MAAVAILKHLFKNMQAKMISAMCYDVKLLRSLLPIFCSLAGP